ncbi:TRAP transporter small permease subunit [Aliihoeflea sp. 40Bstr573]|uniref:TRAP transporter small permease subunit n=1 Tax=Aliihoeflea sp. 40Bstr573 TaxID=2696467 RepID=UPI00209497B7|nr:TRAP transporter small permease [Aliihoeflea sp. 40Bstr573]MCO6386059.1 TRAP transporter small permease subunit [Aliihoeflea sp. 40Bstr573]
MSEPIPDIEEGTGRPAAAGLFGVAANALAAIGTIWIFLLMFLIVADVIGRNFLDSPITGVAEIAARSVVAIVFLQISAAVLAGRMTRADFLVNYIRKVSPGLMRAIDVVFLLVGAAVFAAITYAAFPEMTKAWRSGEYFGVQGIFTIPTLPFRAIIVIGSVAALISYLILTVRAATQDDFEAEAGS